MTLSKFYTQQNYLISQKIDMTSTISEDTSLIIHILKGSSLQGVTSSYIESSIQDQSTTKQSLVDALRRGYFSNDRISIEPGNTITIVNNDIVSHSIISGKENYGDRYNPFTPDGRIASGEIASGESVDITFSEAGFYRLYDPVYNWMEIVAYVFPNSDSLILGQSKNLGN